MPGGKGNIRSEDGKPFKPGVSGNPAGRPPKLPALDELLAKVMLEEKDGFTAAEAILRALILKAKKGDVRAAELLLDRGYGKALQSIRQTEETVVIFKRQEG